MSRAPRKRGFTLVELLVAVAVTTLLAAALLGVTAGALNLWSRTQDRFSADTQVSLVFDFLQRDLSAALFRPNGGRWLAADIINSSAALANHGWLTPIGMKPETESSRYVPEGSGGTGPAIRDARFGRSGVWLRLFTTNLEAGASLPIAVSYQIAWRPLSGAVSTANPAAARYSLFRSAVSSNVTFASGYGSISSTPPAQRSAGTLTNPNTAGDVLATDVIDFGVWFYARDAAGGLVRIFPVDNSDVSHTAGAVADFPVVADVMVRILTGNGANLVAAIEAGGVVHRPESFASDADWWWSTVEANSRVYVRRLNIRAVAQ
jgi:prepilin-type N-terminal cleavage/methylation domain-containing protein